MVFREGDYSPVELAWCARVTKEKYTKILEKYSDIRSLIEEKSHAESDDESLQYADCTVEKCHNGFPPFCFRMCG